METNQFSHTSGSVGEYTVSVWNSDKSLFKSFDFKVPLQDLKKPIITLFVLDVGWTKCILLSYEDYMKGIHWQNLCRMQPELTIGIKLRNSTMAAHRFLFRKNMLPAHLLMLMVVRSFKSKIWCNGLWIVCNFQNHSLKSR